MHCWDTKLLADPRRKRRRRNEICFVIIFQWLEYQVLFVFGLKEDGTLRRIVLGHKARAANAACRFARRYWHHTSPLEGGGPFHYPWSDVVLPGGRLCQRQSHSAKLAARWRFPYLAVHSQSSQRFAPFALLALHQVDGGSGFI